MELDATVETAESAGTDTEVPNPNSDKAKAAKPDAENPNPGSDANAERDTVKPDAEKEAKSLTQEQLNRIIKRESDRAVAAALKAEADKKAEAEMSELDKLKKKLADAEAQATQARREALTERIAHKHGLPDEMRDRLRGESEEDLDADAASLAKLLIKPATRREAPASEATRNGGSDALMTHEEMAATAARLGMKMPAEAK